jgi:hypothetical protein
MCSVEGCGRKAIAKELCGMHYRRKAKGRDLAPPHRCERKCSIEGCENKHDARGLCSFHDNRRRRGIPMDAPARYSTPRKCSVIRCNRNARTHGMCVQHYRRWKDGKDYSRPLLADTAIPGTCKTCRAKLDDYRKNYCDYTCRVFAQLRKERYGRYEYYVTRTRAAASDFALSLVRRGLKRKHRKRGMGGGSFAAWENNGRYVVRYFKEADEEAAA